MMVQTELGSKKTARKSDLYKDKKEKKKTLLFVLFPARFSVGVKKMLEIIGKTCSVTPNFFF